LLKVIKIPTQKGEHCCKCTELSLQRKEGIRKTGFKQQLASLMFLSQVGWEMHDFKHVKILLEKPLIVNNAITVIVF